MNPTTLERMRAELDEWRARLDRLRLQTHLGKMEARDKLRELGLRMDPAWRRARRQLDAVGAGSAAEARALAASLRAGWDELRRTHRELTRESSGRRCTSGAVRSRRSE